MSLPAGGCVTKTTNNIGGRENVYQNAIFRLGETETRRKERAGVGVREWILFCRALLLRCVYLFLLSKIIEQNQIRKRGQSPF